MRTLASLLATALLTGVLAALPGTPAAGVTLAEPTIEPLWPHDPLTVGREGSVGVRVSVDGVPATGLVHLLFDGVEVGNGEWLSEELGVASFAVPRDLLPAGQQQLTFVYDGDASTAPAEHTTHPFFVYDRLRMRLMVRKAPTRHAAGVLVVRWRRPSDDAPAPTWKVNVRLERRSDGRVLRKTAMLADERTVLRVHRLARGRWVARARYLGDDWYGVRRTHGQTFRVR